MFDPGGTANAAAGFIGAEGWHRNAAAIGWFFAGSHADASLLHRDDAIWAAAESGDDNYEKTGLCCFDNASNNNASNNNASINNDHKASDINHDKTHNNNTSANDSATNDTENDFEDDATSDDHHKNHSSVRVRSQYSSWVSTMFDWKSLIEIKMQIRLDRISLETLRPSGRLTGCFSTSRWNPSRAFTSRACSDRSMME